MTEKIKRFLNPDISRIKVLNGSHLKLIAVISMLIDHIGVFLLPEFSQLNILLFRFRGLNIDIAYILDYLGKFAFPIFCFLITEGYIHTHNRIKYGRNLLIFAFISEIPYNYVFTGSLSYRYQNVFFTLFLGYISICLYERYRGNIILQGLSVLALTLLSVIIKGDYITRGFLMVLLLYVLRNEDIVKSFIGTALLNKGYRCIVCYVPICMYNGERGFIKGKVLKYAFYIFYPLHLLILGIIKWEILN